MRLSFAPSHTLFQYHHDARQADATLPGRPKSPAGVTFGLSANRAFRQFIFQGTRLHLIPYNTFRYRESLGTTTIRECVWKKTGFGQSLYHLATEDQSKAKGLIILQMCTLHCSGPRFSIRDRAHVHSLARQNNK